MAKSLRRGLLIIIAAAVLAGAWAPVHAATTKPVIAVLYFETDNCKAYWGPVVARYLMTAIAYMGEYKAVSSDKIDKIMEGSGIKEGGAMTTAEAAGLGKKVGAVVATRGKVSKAGEQYTVTVDFVSTVNGAIITTKSAKVTGEENLSKAIDRIVGLTS